MRPRLSPYLSAVFSTLFFSPSLPAVALTQPQDIDSVTGTADQYGWAQGIASSSTGVLLGVGTIAGNFGARMRFDDGKSWESAVFSPDIAKLGTAPTLGGMTNDPLSDTAWMAINFTDASLPRSEEESKQPYDKKYDSLPVAQ